MSSNIFAIFIFGCALSILVYTAVNGVKAQQIENLKSQLDAVLQRLELAKTQKELAEDKTSDLEKKIAALEKVLNDRSEN